MGKAAKKAIEQTQGLIIHQVATSVTDTARVGSIFSAESQAANSLMGSGEFSQFWSEDAANHERYSGDGSSSQRGMSSLFSE